MEPVLPESKLENVIRLVKRFSAGAVIGLVIAVMHWYWYATYFGYSLPLTRGITGCVLLVIICGLMTLKWGYKTLETLLENLS
ncbi:hypothetical protein [Nostoc sp. LEGE 12447]|uniref:hypothetical protein n=1 Tax=Nostoc sp. LEGE 12447 TaxID=1828640 RepID=UPI001D156034|nr:hypothetical protein [Nostoc sp. LEGE 12447]